MNGWLRPDPDCVQIVLPILSQVNVQRVFWQKRCDRLLYQILCNHCIETKTTRLPKAKAWIGSPIIVVHADPSDVSLNKLLPTGNGRNP